MRAAYDGGALVACEVVWAEVRAHFPSDAELEQSLALLRVRFESISSEAAAMAGRLWRESAKGGRNARARRRGLISWALTPRSRRTFFSRETVASIGRHFRVTVIDPSAGT